jgi:two-component system sensor histidine kinase KdpD
MTTKPVKVVLVRIVVGSSSAMLLTLLAFRLHFNLSSATSIHLFLVVILAIRWGLLEASLVSILSVACLDYFFTEPLFQFYITDSHDWIAIMVFEATALIVSSLSNQVSHHARELERRQAQQERLYELSQHILLLDRNTVVDQQLVDLIRSSLRVKGVALWNGYEMHQCKSGDCDVPNGAIRSASLDADEDDLDVGISRRVLRLGTRPIGSIYLCGHSLDAASVNAAASLAAVAIERARSFTTETNAEAAKQSEQLRSAILDGLAHDFKSPLTTIRTSSSGLLAMNTLSGTEARLVGLIDRHAGHLSDLANHLLLTAKLDGGDLKVKREQVDVAQLIQNTVAECAQELNGHPINFQSSSERNLAYVDKKLLQMALFQVLDNAAKYSRPASQVVIVVEEEEAELVIRIKNEGSFIPDIEKEKVFQRFYRCSGSVKSISGTGIGLSVVRRIAEAHTGRTWVESDQVNGTTFAIALPRMAKEKV